jgi:hypothetical protein
MEAIMASGGLKICKDKGRFGLFLASQEIDWFADYNDASKLAQDLFVAKASTDDPMIGTRKFCPGAVNNGQIVVVVSKSRNGYIVQPAGTNGRMEVSAEVLSDPLAYDDFVRQAAYPPKPAEPLGANMEWVLMTPPDRAAYWDKREIPPGQTKVTPA